MILTMGKLALGAAVNQIAGKYGHLSVAQTRGGLVIRSRPRYRRPVSPAMAGAAARMKQASQTWAAISNAEAEAWNAYAATLRHHNPLTGQAYAPAGFNVFVGLATKVLQITPEAEIPRTPPAQDFLGDQTTLTATSLPAAIRLTASGPNSEGTLTEILLQRMVNIKRSITKDFKTTAFVAFTTENPTHDFYVQSGAYAIAYRFVDPSTGQATLPQLVGKVEVG